MRMQSSVFLPLQSGLGFEFWGSLLATLAGIVAVLYFLKKPANRSTLGRLRPLFSLLGFLVVLIAGSTAFFSAWRYLQLEAIVLDGEQIQSAYGTTLLRDIRTMGLEPDVTRSLVNPFGSGDTTWLLVLETRDGKAQVFSEQDYPVHEIMKALEEIAKQRTN